MFKGLVTASYGKRFEVELQDLSKISCVTRGKKTDLACGDIVNINLTDNNEGVIESCEPRSSLLFRSNSFRKKLLAANVTQVVIILATTPSFYETLLNRCLIASESSHITSLIVLNKCDLVDPAPTISKLSLYSDLGYKVQKLSAKEDISPLKELLLNNRSVLVGQSGMGKSTIINALFTDLNVRTQEISRALDSGKHTTTATHLYRIDEKSQIIDSPGLQEFGLNHLNVETLENAFIEFRPYLGKCRFNNCRHLHEPDCAIARAVEENSISMVRLKNYREILVEIT